MGKLLHITNGDSFTERLKNISFPGDILTWREMLCEGPAPTAVFSNDFIDTRCQFLGAYSTSQYLEEEYKTMAFHFSSLNFETYDSVTLWFEYDLFCHVNFAAAVYFFKEKHPNLPLYLICSGALENETKLFGLNDLSNNQLLEEAKKRIQLDAEAIKTLIDFWKIYTSSSHKELSSLGINTAIFPYLRACIRAHLFRFPAKGSGLNALEFKVLIAIAENEFVSQKQLMGYLLKNQDYYGFGDVQWIKIIAKVKPYFTELLHLSLTIEGVALIQKKGNVFNAVKDTTQFGGVYKYHHLYDKTNNQLIYVNEN